MANTYYSGEYEWELIDDPAAGHLAAQSVIDNATIIGKMPDGTPVTASKGKVWKRGRRYKCGGSLLKERLNKHIGD